MTATAANTRRPNSRIVTGWLAIVANRRPHRVAMLSAVTIESVGTALDILDCAVDRSP